MKTTLCLFLALLSHAQAPKPLSTVLRFQTARIAQERKETASGFDWTAWNQKMVEVTENGNTLWKER